MPSAIRAALVVAVVVLAAQRAAAQTSVALIDPDVTVGAGATLANAIGDLTAAVQARWVPDRLLEERGVVRRAGNIGYRVLRLLLLDVPQAEFLLVGNHEVFGHGGRVREQFDGPLQFRVEPPWPYGRGGGVTIFGIDRDFTVHELQAVTVAGMEVNAVAAEQLARRSLREGRLSPRAALRYLAFELDAFDYIQHTGDEPEPPGHDVSDFLELYNALAEISDTASLTPRTLRRESWLALANPMLASALVSIGRHVATGHSEGVVFAIPVASYRLMPALRYRLAPWGTEWAVSADTARAGDLAQLIVRVGRAPGATPWGVSGRYAGVTVGTWQLEVGAEVWRQPPLALGPQPDFGLALAGAGHGWGGQVRARAESALLPLFGTTRPFTLVIDAGVKSTGFVPGEPLARGLVLRAGLGLPIVDW